MLSNIDFPVFVYRNPSINITMITTVDINSAMFFDLMI